MQKVKKLPSYFFPLPNTLSVLPVAKGRVLSYVEILTEAEKGEEPLEITLIGNRAHKTA